MMSEPIDGTLDIDAAEEETKELTNQVMKNVTDIQGLVLAIVFERLKSHGAFLEVHDNTRTTGTEPTVKITSKIGIAKMDFEYW